MEGLPQPRQRGFVEAVEGDGHVELVVLPKVAHLQRSQDLDVLGVALLLEQGDAFADQVREHAVGVALVEGRRGHLRRSLQVDARVRHQEAEGGELARMVGHDAAADVGMDHEVGDVDRAGAAEGQQREVAGVEAALGQHRT